VEEPGEFLLGAELHDPLDARPVVPGPVEQDQLAGRRQVRDVALEVPLGLLAFGRGRQGGDAGEAGVQVLGDPLDRAALAGRVAALEDDDDPGAGGAQPLLHLHQLPLQPVKLGFVRFARQPRRLRCHST
jgi:hypothetical protein